MMSDNGWFPLPSGTRVRGNVIVFKPDTDVSKISSLGDAGYAQQCERVTDWVYQRSSGKIYLAKSSDSIVLVASISPIEQVQITSSIGMCLWEADIRQIKRANVRIQDIRLPTTHRAHAQERLSSDVDIPANSRVWYAIKRREKIPWALDIRATLEIGTRKYMDRFAQACCENVFSGRALHNLEGRFSNICCELAWVLNPQQDVTIQIAWWVIWWAQRGMPAVLPEIRSEMKKASGSTPLLIAQKTQGIQANPIMQVAIQKQEFPKRKKRRREPYQLAKSLEIPLDQLLSNSMASMNSNMINMLKHENLNRICNGISFMFVTSTIPRILSPDCTEIVFDVFFRVWKRLLLIPCCRWAVCITREAFQAFDTLLNLNSFAGFDHRSTALLTAYLCMYGMIPRSVRAVFKDARDAEEKRDEHGDFASRVIEEEEKLEIVANRISCSTVVVEIDNQANSCGLLNALTKRVIKGNNGVSQDDADDIEGVLSLFHEVSPDHSRMFGRKRLLGFRSAEDVSISQLLKSRRKERWDAVYPEWMASNDAAKIIIIRCLQLVCNELWPGEQTCVEIPARSINGGQVRLRNVDDTAFFSHNS